MDCPECNAKSPTDRTTCPACGGGPTPDPADAGGKAAAPPDDPVVVAVEVWNVAEGEIICALLQAHGIPCILQAENQYAVDANYSIGPLARRRILVRGSDLGPAREILRATPVADPPPGI